MKKTTAKKVPAKRGSQRRQAGVLLERTDKVVTKDKGTVLKIFGPSTFATGRPVSAARASFIASLRIALTL